MNWKEKVNKQVTYIIDVKSRYGNYSSFEKTFNDVDHYNNWCNYMTKRGNKIIGEELITKKLNEMKKQVIISNGIKPTYAEGGEIEENNGDITVAENKIKDLEFYPNYDAEIIEVGLGKKRVDAQIFFDADGRDYILINDKINYVDDLGFEIYSLGNSENTEHFGDLYEDDFLRFEEEGKIINLNNDLSADERGAWHYYFISDDKYANEISKKLITKN